MLPFILKVCIGTPQVGTALDVVILTSEQLLKSFNHFAYSTLPVSIFIFVVLFNDVYVLSLYVIHVPFTLKEISNLEYSPAQKLSFAKYKAIDVYPFPLYCLSVSFAASVSM